MMPLGCCACSSCGRPPTTRSCGTLLITSPRAKVKPYFCPVTNAPNRWRSQTIRRNKCWKERVSCDAARLFPLGFDAGRLDDVLARLVAPAIARVGDRRRDVDVRKLAPRRHLAAGRRLLHDTVGLAVEHDVDLMLRRSQHDRVADECRRADRGVARSGRLMARGAVRIEDLLAMRNEVLQVPDLVRILGGRGELLFLLAEPFRVVVL